MLIAPVAPFLLKTADNPEGVPGSLFDGFIKAAIAQDQLLAFLTAFFANFYNLDVLLGKRISDEVGP